MSLLLLFGGAAAREVWISPTDDINDAGAVQQTITADSDVEITFTSVQGGLTAGVDLYLFVVNPAGESNASGFIVQFQAGGTGRIFVLVGGGGGLAGPARGVVA